jgi:hypothetical protein
MYYVFIVYSLCILIHYECIHYQNQNDREFIQLSVSIGDIFSRGKGGMSVKVHHHVLCIRDMVFKGEDIVPYYCLYVRIFSDTQLVGE